MQSSAVEAVKKTSIKWATIAFQLIEFVTCWGKRFRLVDEAAGAG